MLAPSDQLRLSDFIPSCTVSFLVYAPRVAGRLFEFLPCGLGF